MSELSYRFSPDDMRLKTGIGIREPKLIRIPRTNGTALYGPYIDLLAGRYQAVIRFDPDTACCGRAIMDVCAGPGVERLAEQWITADQILAGGMSAKLEFSSPRPLRGVEVRLLTDGAFSAGIVSVEISGELDKDTSEFETQDEIKNTLRLLRPYAAEGITKARFGSPHDGGYILLDDFRDVDTAFSFGVEQNASWDVDVAERGLTVYQFDHTVEAPIKDNARLIFARKKISPDAGLESESLFSLVKRHDRHNAKPNILLKIDIENDEWAVFDATPPEIVSRFSQIVGEFHYLQGLSNVHWRQLFTRVLEKLSNSYAVVHVHANNMGGFSNVANVIFPNVLEVTFANRSIYSFADTAEIFPGPLDAPNDPSHPDLHLGSFHF
jgi:hypothetical protein